MRRLCVIGAGGHGKVVADSASAMKKYENIVFLDVHHLERDNVAGYQVLAAPDEVEGFIDDETEFFVAIGDNYARRDWLNRLSKTKAHIATIMHPSVVLSSNVTVSPGTLLAPGVVINIDSSIGQGCIINTRAHIDHDSQIGDFVHIGPGSHIAGTVSVGTLSFIGIGTSIIQGMTIGMNAQTGAGAAVVNDIPDNMLAVGVPARSIKQRPSRDIKQ